MLFFMSKKESISENNNIVEKMQKCNFPEKNSSAIERNHFL
jgi:hypothetical protein